MIAFSKYHGCGNNFAIVRETQLIEYLGLKTVDIEAYQKFAKKICNINIGVGADGLIVVRENPELEMVFFNCDGSRAPMCGNGIRCFANYCYDTGIRSEDSYTVKTLAGDMTVDITCKEPFRVKINMGSPVYSPSSIGVDDGGDDFLGRSIELSCGGTCDIDSLFMGTVHTVVFAEDVESDRIEKIGKEICNHPLFREKTNVNFVKVIDDKMLMVKTYERGVGLTLACGTGACASVVVAHLKGICKAEAEVILELGKLTINIGRDGNVYMEGPSVKILEGTFC